METPNLHGVVALSINQVAINTHLALIFCEKHKRLIASRDSFLIFNSWELQLYYTTSVLIIKMVEDNIILLVLWSFLFLSVVKVHCQTYLSFLGENLSNNSYVDFSLVGDMYDGSDSVQCHTQFLNCCRLNYGEIAGNWFFPNGDRLTFNPSNGIHQRRTAQRVDLRTIQNTSVTGIYCCDIPYNSSVRENLCVGLYNYAGNQNGNS